MALGEWFRIISRWTYIHPIRKSEKPKFVHLGPTADADKAGAYFEALDFATKQEEVLNIALTGPYGSGKSSVIKSFLRQYSGRALEISLASFRTDVQPPGGATSSRTNTAEIERSILQQIVYRVEADKLPFSRFKRIQTPKRYAFVVSAVITLGLSAVWSVVSKSDEILSGTFFKLELPNLLNYISLLVAGVFIWRIVHAIYTTSFGLSLKSISLKDVQIAPDAANEASILNRHFDEILYFFQSTDYDLVVIEDLDRFENTDIFVTLREINALINGNEGIKRPIRFLYALRDDIFANTDRTKFFEFIVPIVPIISHSNSIDKVLEQSKRADLDSRLNRRFIHDVARHLTDMRLIHNIFNEYAVYSANIQAGNADALDPNKLLAVLIYKNVIPKDFAALHRQEGALSKVLGRYDEYVRKIEGELKQAIFDIEAELADGEAQLLKDQSELRKVYAMSILETIPRQYHTLQLPSGNTLPLAKLAESDEFDSVVNARSVTIIGGNYGQSTGHSIQGLESSVDPDRSFADRKAAIERKSNEFKQNSQRRIRELKRELGSIRTRKFNEVVRGSTQLIDTIFAEVGENQELLKFLILEGYLDDTYYQYISLFHSGRLSPNDNRFLILIRAYSNPPPDFPIDNVAEVITAMRKEDFGHDYVLNRFIVDHMLANAPANDDRIEAAVDFIRDRFEQCEDFFRSYYERGAQVPKLIDVLVRKWPEFGSVALTVTDNISHAARILAYAPDRILEKPPYAGGAFSTFVSERTLEILEVGVDFDPARLAKLKVRVSDVASIAGHFRVHSFVEQSGAYSISIANLRHVLSLKADNQTLEGLNKRHYTTLLEAGDAALLGRIDRDFEDYVREVLLKIDGNCAEKVGAIIVILSRNDVAPALLEEFLSRQEAIFPRFDGVPATFYAGLLERLKIEPTWENCRIFLASKFFDHDVLTRFLNSDRAKGTLSLLPVPGGDDGSQLQAFLIENNDLDLDAYRAYVKRLPGPIDAFPEADTAQLRILIEEHRVTFTPENWGKLDDKGLRVLFLAENFAGYGDIKANYPIDDDYRSELLQSGILTTDKLAVIDEIDPSYVVTNPSVAGRIGLILNQVNLATVSYGSDFVAAVVANSRPVKLQIFLLNKLHDRLSETEILGILERLPNPYCDIASRGKSPKIEHNDLNAELASWLKADGVISSYSPTFQGDEIRINTFKKKT